MEWCYDVLFDDSKEHLLSYRDSQLDLHNNQVLAAQQLRTGYVNTGHLGHMVPGSAKLLGLPDSLDLTHVDEHIANEEKVRDQKAALFDELEVTLETATDLWNRASVVREQGRMLDSELQGLLVQTGQAKAAVPGIITVFKGITMFEDAIKSIVAK